MSDELTDLERAFCRKYALRDCRDPTRTYVETFGPASCDLLAALVEEFMQRNDIRLEIYVLQRTLAVSPFNRAVEELEEARQKALAYEDDYVLPGEVKPATVH